MSKQLKLFQQDKTKGYFCECCGQLVKEYTRKLNSNMALALTILARNKEYGYVHIENYMIQNGYKRSGDFSYLVHWGLVEKLKEKRKDGSSRNGMYRITGLGIMFAENKIEQKEAALIQNNKCNGLVGEMVNIKKCLGRHFNYDELMGN